MGCRCLSEIENRILLWRNTIQLFHSYKSIGFTGPFFQAGFKEYVIEADFPTEGKSEKKTPDIVTSGPSGWVCIELTGKDGSKESQLEEYTHLDPRFLDAIHGLPPQKDAADVISSRLDPFEDGNYCQITVRNQLSVKKTDNLNNQILRECLKKSNGIDLNRLPTIPISLVPESKNLEIRRGIIDIIMALFDEHCEGLTSQEIAIKALDRLEAKTPDLKIKELSNKIDKELQVAVNEHLKGYLQFNNNKYNAGKKFWKYPNSRQKIGRLLIEWATEPQTKLNNWWKKSPHNPKI